MRMLIAIVLILGACFVVLVGLLSVVHDLLIRTSSHVPREMDQYGTAAEHATLCSTVSPDQHLTTGIGGS